MAGNTARVLTWNKIVGFGAVASGLIAIAFSLRLGLDPAMYFPGYDLKQPKPFQFPLAFFAITCGFIVIYTIAGFLSLAKMRWSIWLRSLIAMAILVPWTLYVSQFFIHMPGFWFVHLLYLWVVLIVIGVTFLLSVALSTWGRLKRGNASHA